MNNNYWVDYVCDKTNWNKETLKEIRDGLDKVLENWQEDEEDNDK